MRVLVTGSRDWDDYEIIRSELDKILGWNGYFTLVHGDCPTGADHFADMWGREVGLDLADLIERHPAEWKGPRKRGAGYARNAEMVNLGADLCLAFILNESNGSTHCAELAKKAGIDTEIFRRKSVESGTTLEVKRAALARRDVTLKNVQSIYKNFEGRHDDCNAAGHRYFHVLLDPVTADILEKQGYNIKRKPPLEEGGEEFIHMKVKVNFKGRPPTVALISRTKGTRNTLDADTVQLADHAEFDRIDMTISPYDWKLKSGQTGRTAYLQEFFGFLYESPLEQLYAHYIEESELEALEIPQDLGMDDIDVISDTGWEIEGEPKAIGE